MTRRFRENGCGLVVQYVVLKVYVKCTKCASGSVVEHHLAKVGAAGSNPVSRFFYFLKILVLQDLLFLCIKMKKQAPKNLPFMVQ